LRSAVFEHKTAILYGSGTIWFFSFFPGTSEGEGETGEASHNKLEDMIKGITNSLSHFVPLANL
jgi:hypothetical protein